MAALTDRMRSRVVLLIDGGSGSGKTELSMAFQEIWPGGAQLVHLDDCYPGWDGLATGAAQVPGMMSARRPGYWSWDWETNSPGGWVDLRPKKDLIIEGCGALTPESVRLATASVWCQMDAATRKLRALTREPAFVTHWDMWEEQEQQHWATNRPRQLAEFVVRVE